MNTTNKILISVLILAFICLIIGSWSKINGYESLEWLLTIGFILKPVIIFSLLIYNFKNIKMMLK